MAKLSFKVGHVYCYDCVAALGKFIGKMKGVISVEVKNNENAVVEYEPSQLELDEAKFRQLVVDSIGKLGFTIKEY